MRVAKGWGTPDEKLWPYDGDADHWPPIEPEGIDAQAKALRVRAYQRASTVDECRVLLASHHPVQTGFEIDDSWPDAPNGMIPAPDNQTLSGAHSVVLAGYDDGQQTFKFINSWGAAWGDDGYGYLPYSYFQERFLEGWVLIADIELPPGGTGGIGFRTWGILDLFGNIFHGAEIVDHAEDEVVAWGFAIERREFLELEELFVRPSWRLHGYGSQLAEEFSRLAARLGSQLWAWIPHSDVGTENRMALSGVLRHLGLSRTSSPVRWAAAAEQLL